MEHFRVYVFIFFWSRFETETTRSFVCLLWAFSMTSSDSNFEYVQIINLTCYQLEPSTFGLFHLRISFVCRHIHCFQMNCYRAYTANSHCVDWNEWLFGCLLKHSHKTSSTNSLTCSTIDCYFVSRLNRQHLTLMLRFHCPPSFYFKKKNIFFKNYLWW